MLLQGFEDPCNKTLQIKSITNVRIGAWLQVCPLRPCLSGRNLLLCMTACVSMLTASHLMARDLNAITMWHNQARQSSEVPLKLLAQVMLLIRPVCHSFGSVIAIIAAAVPSRRGFHNACPKAFKFGATVENDQRRHLKTASLIS